MNMHPVIGADIIRPVERLKPELPIIRHHHEWYNGSGYPDHLVGRGHPQAGPHPSCRRCLRGDDCGPAVPPAAADRRTGHAGTAALRGHPIRPVVLDAFARTA